MSMGRRSGCGRGDIHPFLEIASAYLVAAMVVSVVVFLTIMVLR